MLRRQNNLFSALLLVCFWSAVQCDRIATQKCAEYQKLVTRKQSIIHLTIDPEPITFDVVDCSNEVKLIVGGEEAQYGEFPHHVLLGYAQKDKPKKYGFLCGGTLISEQHVLTAAHCFAEEDPVVVRLGEYDTTAFNIDEQQIEIAKILRHPEFTNSRSYHDIALIKLKTPASMSPHVRPACLWVSEHRNLSRYIATGFGFNESFSDALSTVMMKVQLDEFPVDDCTQVYKNDRRFRNGIQDGQLCVGSIVGGRDTCQGDSGGPLQINTNSETCTYAVVGITSTGGACGIGQSKAIYTKVSHYIDWIEANVWGPNAL